MKILNKLLSEVYCFSKTTNFYFKNRNYDSEKNFFTIR